MEGNELRTVWYGEKDTARLMSGGGYTVTGSQAILAHSSHVRHNNMPTLAAGAIVSSRYRIDRPLGTGAFATVYSAWDMNLHRWVAAKVCDAALSGSISASETQLQASCQHPNLMPLHDAGSDPLLGITYLIMPLYPGADLAATLVHHGPMPFRAAALCVDQVCSALEFLWQRRQAVHGDVKPANIWLTGSGAALLMDFNLHGLLSSGLFQRAGTPGFTAPEALQGQHTPCSDVFSLGCVLYACLAGAPPFADDSAALSGRYTPLRDLRPEIHPEMEAVVRMALAPSPEHRFATPREFQTAIRCPRRTMAMMLHTSLLHRALRMAGACAKGTAEVCLHGLAWTAGCGWLLLGWTASGALRLIGQSLNSLWRRPLQTIVTGLMLAAVAQWAFLWTVAWAHVHSTQIISILAASLILGILQGGHAARHRCRRRAQRLAHRRETRITDGASGLLQQTLTRRWP